MDGAGGDGIVKQYLSNKPLPATTQTTAPLPKEGIKTTPYLYMSYHPLESVG
jgi:hypothetical protein